MGNIVRKKKSFHLAAMLALSVACMVGGVFLFSSCKMQAGPTAEAAVVVTDGQTLFYEDGTYNKALATQLMKLAAPTLEGGAGRSTPTGLTGGASISLAGQIRTANWNETTGVSASLPIVNLFQSGGTGTAQTFRAQSWRLVAISHPSSGSPVFTFLMTAAYRSSQFFTSNTSTPYESSTVRTNLRNDFHLASGNVISSFPGMEARIVTPRNIPGGWQASQPQTATSNGGNNIAEAALDDLIWLPSSHEFQDGNVTANPNVVWGLTTAANGERSYTIPSGVTNAASAWLRSSQNNGNPRTVASNGNSFGNSSPNTTLAVRPALHITFPAVTSTDPLFNTHGVHNTSLGNQLTQMAEQAGKTTLTGQVRRSDAAQILSVNGGELPEITIFAAGGASTIQSFRAQKWKLAYITYPATYPNPSTGAPIFTFIMAGPYKNDTFHTSSNVYETSNVRTNLNNDFSTVIGAFPAVGDLPGVSNFIVKPQDMPGAWQTSGQTSTSGTNNNLVGTALNDSVWLPSSTEMGDGIATGFWNLPVTARNYTQGSFGANAWLRSGATGLSGSARTVAASGGTFASTTVNSGSIAVRPAMHITMPLPDDNALDYDLITENSVSSYLVRGATYPGSIRTINIPDTYKGLPVTQVGQNAFLNRTLVTSLTIGSNITHIGQSAFNGCTGLTGSLSLPSSLQVLSQEAFRNTGFSGTLTIPNQVTVIGNGVFRGSNFHTLELGASVQEIGPNAFDGCTNLRGTLTLPYSMRNIGSSAFTGCTGLQGIVMREGLLAIGDNAFWQCNGIEGTLSIPNSVTTIGDFAFRNCTSITRITIGTGITSIGQLAFQSCTAVATLDWNIPNYTGTISTSPGGISPNPGEGHPFVTLGGNGTGVTVNIGNNVTRIPNNLLYINTVSTSRPHVTAINFGTAVTHIGDNAFRDLPGFRFLTIPSTIQSIGSAAFYGCTMVETLTWNVPNSSGTLTFPSAHPFENFGRNPASSNTLGVDVIIGNSVRVIPANFMSPSSMRPNVRSVTFSPTSTVTTIGSSAFAFLPGISSIAIPNSVTTIGNGAFQNCIGISGGLVLSANVTSIGSNAFAATNISILQLNRFTVPGYGITNGPGDQFSSLITSTSGRIVVPAGSGDTYRNSSGWSLHANVIVELISPIYFSGGTTPTGGGSVLGTVAPIVIDPISETVPLLSTEKFRTEKPGWIQAGWTLQVNGKELGISDSLSSNDYAMGAPVPLTKISETNKTFYAVWQKVVTRGVVYVHFVGSPEGTLFPSIPATWSLDPTQTTPGVHNQTTLLPSASEMSSLGSSMQFDGWYMYTDLACTTAVKITAYVNPGIDNRFVIPWETAPSFNNIAVIRIYAKWI